MNATKFHICSCVLGKLNGHDKIFWANHKKFISINIFSVEMVDIT